MRPERRRQLVQHVNLTFGIVTCFALLVGCGGGGKRDASQVEQLQLTVTALQDHARSPDASVTAAPAPAATATVHTCGLDEIDEAKRSVVRLESSEGSGSGFILMDGSIVTNAHVVNYERSLRVQFGDGTKATATVFAVSATRDLALLKPSRIPAELGLEWGNSSSLRGSQTVLAIGFPLGLSGEASVARGSVSRTVIEAGVEYIQTDTALNPGNSGGPLLDECGKVVGVVTWGITNAEGLGFALSEREARRETISLAASPSPQRMRSPVEVVEQFFSLIDQQQYDSAYGLLSSRYRASHPPVTWKGGYKTTVGVQLSSGAIEISQQPRVVDVTYLAGDNVNGQFVVRTFSESWTLVQEDGEWRMDTGKILSVR